MVFDHDDYTVGWICPLVVEQGAARLMLDKIHGDLPQDRIDHNVYTLGSINGHNIVIAGLPTMGNNSAASVVVQMRNTFRSIRFCLVVGIGGGVPTMCENIPIRLGDVVVSSPTGNHSGAIQYDHGKAKSGGFERTGCLQSPPTVLLNAANKLAVCRNTTEEGDPLAKNLERIDVSKQYLQMYSFPGREKDHLYSPLYLHADASRSCMECGCDASQRISRSDDNKRLQDGGRLVVHHGTIASGELVLKDGYLRDILAKQYNILCFEMEAAGALNDCPCLVIRGISDYCDSHKNNIWHGFAAAAAASYARQLFFYMPLYQVKAKPSDAGKNPHHHVLHVVSHDLAAFPHYDHLPC